MSFCYYDHQKLILKTLILSLALEDPMPLSKGPEIGVGAAEKVLLSGKKVLKRMTNRWNMLFPVMYIQ